MRITGLWNGHDCSYCILDNGIPTIHAELERYIREKEPMGDSYKLFKEHGHDENKIDIWVGVEDGFSHEKHIHKGQIPSSEGFTHEYYIVGHHQAHAANAFFSSNLSEALICTFDGGGMDNGEFSTTTAWSGKDNLIKPLMINGRDLNIGNIWTRVTGQCLGLSTGHPYGHSAGTVMATACLGDKNRYWKEFTSNVYYFLDTWKDRPEKDDDQAKYDLAATLQQFTEDLIKKYISTMLEKYPSRNLCLAGGVVLNCVMTTKLYDWFDLDNIYVTPTPHDGGLTIGAAQYLWHHELGNPRIEWKDHLSPYLGVKYSKDQVSSAIDKYEGKVSTKVVADEDVLHLINDQKIVSVFGGSSESGRRALGNRSILADPRSDKMKDIINEKVKHRQWFRPFAPSILREEVKNWFVKDIDSPYMNFAVKFKDDMKDKVPAVIHLDNTGRIQTVTNNDNSWYYNFIKKWHKISGVPILLNTSFNDREPIVETPEHAINCFMGTNIDYLYFREYNILVERL
jgi:carbamoyltransferase